MSTTFIIGIVASVLTAISLLPQLIKLIKLKKPSDISMLMLVTLFTGLSLWVWYGFLKNDWIIIIANIVSTAINVSIVCLNLWYKMHNNEEEAVIDNYPDVGKN